MLLLSSSSFFILSFSLSLTNSINLLISWAFSLLFSLKASRHSLYSFSCKNHTCIMPWTNYNFLLHPNLDLFEHGIEMRYFPRQKPCLQFTSFSGKFVQVASTPDWADQPSFELVLLPFSLDLQELQVPTLEFQPISWFPLQHDPTEPELSP